MDRKVDLDEFRFGHIDVSRLSLDEILGLSENKKSQNPYERLHYASIAYFRAMHPESGAIELALASEAAGRAALCILETNLELNLAVDWLWRSVQADADRHD